MQNPEICTRAGRVRLRLNFLLAVVRFSRIHARCTSECDGCGRDQLEGEVEAGEGGEGAQLAQPQVDERPAKHPPVVMLHHRCLEQRVHLAEVVAHLVRHGAVDRGQRLEAVPPPGVAAVILFEVLGARGMKPELIGFE